MLHIYRSNNAYVQDAIISKNVFIHISVTHTHTHTYIYIYIYRGLVYIYIYIYICVCVCVCVCLLTPRVCRVWHKVNFKFNKSEKMFFLLRSRLPYQSWRGPSAKLFTHSLGKTNWIHIFAKNISSIWKANILVLGLNS